MKKEFKDVYHMFFLGFAGNGIKVETFNDGQVIFSCCDKIIYNYNGWNNKNEYCEGNIDILDKAWRYLKEHNWIW